MGRHRRPEEKRELGERARAMRIAGRSCGEIRAELGIGDDLARELLRGVPVPDSLRRPRAKDELRGRAQQLRRDGCTYAQIAGELGISKSTCSLWLRDVPHQVPLPLGGCDSGSQSERASRRRRHWDAVLAEREAERLRVKLDAADRLGSVSARELEIMAVVAYWCEGTKDKPYARRKRVTFVNSDPGLVRLFVGYLDAWGFPRENRRYSLSIHESADLAAATRWWAEVIGVHPSALGPAVLKRHNPTTVRKNVDRHYVGCLVVRLVQSRLLYQHIEGVWSGIMSGLAPLTAAPAQE